MANKQVPIKKRFSDLSGDQDEGQSQIPYQNVVTHVVKKIKNEPFLFVIAIVALLIGLVTLATNLGSPDLRFIVIVIASLASIVIFGYYFVKGLELWSKSEIDVQKHNKNLQGDKNIHESNLENFRFDSKAEQHTNTYDLEGKYTLRTDPSNLEEQRVALETELAQHRRNLSRLQVKKSVYAAGEEPLSLLNQIEAETNEIDRLQAQLGIIMHH